MLATGQGALALPVVMVALPVGAIVYGLKIHEVGYVTPSLTSDRKAQRGWGHSWRAQRKPTPGL